MFVQNYIFFYANKLYSLGFSHYLFRKAALLNHTMININIDQYGKKKVHDHFCCIIRHP